MVLIREAPSMSLNAASMVHREGITWLCRLQQCLRFLVGPSNVVIASLPVTRNQGYRVVAFQTTIKTLQAPVLLRPTFELLS